MKRFYTCVAAACAVLGVSAAQFPTAGAMLGTEARVQDAAVEQFLATPFGSQYTADAMKIAQVGDALPQGATLTPLINEDFSTFTQGTPEAPVAIDEANPPAMSYPGEWGFSCCYQAGGQLLMGWISDEDGPGSLATPDLDFSSSDAAFQLRVKARSLYEDQQSLQLFVLDNAGMSIMYAKAFPITKETTEVTWIASASSAQTMVMIYGNRGNVLVENFELQRLEYALPSSDITGVKMLDYNQVEVSFQGVEQAAKYMLEAENADTDEIVATAEVPAGATSAVLEFSPVIGTFYVLRITAVDANGGVSQTRGVTDYIEPDEVGDATAEAATAITNKGFTANWTAAPCAAQYLVRTAYEKYTAPENGTKFYLFDDNFANVPAQYDEYGPAQVVMTDLDAFVNYSGWWADVAFFMSNSYIMTNLMAGYGLPGMLQSPTGNLSVGGGKIHIAGTAMSAADECVISAFVVKDSGPLSKADIELAEPGMPTPFDIVLEGGVDNSCIQMYLTDCAAEEMVMFTDLKVWIELNAGETVAFPQRIFRADAPALSTNVEMALDGDDVASYTVQGIYGVELMGGESEAVTVNATDAGIRSIVTDNAIVTVLPGRGIAVSDACRVYTLDGRLLRSTDGAADIALSRGVYVVTDGTTSCKVVL